MPCRVPYTGLLVLVFLGMTDMFMEMKDNKKTNKLYVGKSFIFVDFINVYINSCEELTNCQSNDRSGL